MVIATLRITVPSVKRAEVLIAARSLLKATRGQFGCLSCECYRDIDNPNIIFLVQEWESTVTLNRYIGSYEYKRILALMDLGSAQPEIKFNTISRTTGIEAIRAARR